MSEPAASTMPSVILRPREERRILSGHAWVFSNEVREVRGGPSPGSVVSVLRSGGKLVGYGLYNPASLIAVRVFSRTHRELDDAFLDARLAEAAALRERIYPGSRALRLVHGESDGLPGLVIDRYGDCYAIQTLALGMDLLKERIAARLAGSMGARAVVERNESPLRDLEGLERRSGLLRGELEGAVRIEEGDLLFDVDPLRGHKTGFYFDQRENRQALRRYAAGLRALDAFCNEGAFALHLAKAGAPEVVGIDASEEAIARAAENARLNGFGGTCAFRVGQLPAALEELRLAGERFGLVNLDPPSYTRSKKSVAAAKKAYVDLNRRAMRILERGGILASASCSHHVTEETFLGCLQEAATSLDRTLRLLEWRTQAPDHPILPAMPETRYLKFAVLQVL